MHRTSTFEAQGSIADGRLHPPGARWVRALVLAAALALSGMTAATASAAQTDFYADPAGAGTSCTQVSPCTLSTAISSATTDGDVVHVDSGNYGTGNTASNFTISHAITVEGVPGSDTHGQPTRARIFSDLGPIITVNASSGTVNLKDLTLEATGTSDTNAALELDSAATVDRVEADSAAGTGCKVTADAVEIRDSLCASTGTGSSGLGADVEEVSATMTTTLRDDTIIENGSNRGLAAAAVFGSLTVDVTNTIISSGNVSIDAFAAQSGSSTTVNVDHSNYNGSRTLIGPCCGSGAATLHDGGGNQTSSPPVFRDAAIYDYHEAASSPTVDAGTGTSTSNGTLDLDGNTRSFGSGPDIGGYEYLPAPSASTGGAQPGQTTAALNGTVNPKGIDTHYWFQYSTASNLLGALSTSAVDAGTGSTDVSATAGLTGLQPATTYYYRVVAASGGGTTEASTINSFTTTDVPSVTTGSSSALDDTSARVAGTVEPNGLDATFFVEYGTSPGSLTSTAAGGDAGSGTTSGPVSVDLTGLQPATTYYYLLAARNTDGTSMNSDVQSFSTSATPVVTTTTPSAVDRTGATIGGAVNPEQRSTDYHFEYRPAGSTGAYTQVTGGSLPAGSSPVTVSAALTGLQPTTAYEWRLVATHGSSGSVTISVAGSNFRTTDVPAAVTGGTSNIGQTGATVAGSVNPNGVDTTYSVEYGTSPGSLTSTAGSGDAGSGTTSGPVSVDLTGLQPASTYYYLLIASNGDGRSTNNDVASFTTEAASLPPTTTTSTPPTTTTTTTTSPTTTTSATPPPATTPSPSRPGAPQLSGLRITPTAFSAAARPRPIITYRGTETGTTTFVVQQVLPGLRDGTRCIAPPKHGRAQGRNCTRLVTVRGTFTHTDVAGIDRLELPATIGGRPLAPGSYVLVATPRNAAAVTGTPESARFKVLPPPRHPRRNRA